MSLSYTMKMQMSAITPQQMKKSMIFYHSGTHTDTNITLSLEMIHYEVVLIFSIFEMALFFQQPIHHPVNHWFLLRLNVELLALTYVLVSDNVLYSIYLVNIR